MKKIVCDIDETICFTNNGDYKNSKPNIGAIEKIKYYKSKGYEICFYTSRNVRTYNGNIGKINVITLPIIIEWLGKYGIPYDEIVVGKPWCGEEGFYVDDKAIRPDEFIKYNEEEIQEILIRDSK